MKITFLLPGLGHNVPIGGFKVVYEYANRFYNDGHDVYIVYIADPLLNGEKATKHIYHFFKYIYKLIFGFSGRKWFPLNKRIKEKLVLFGNKRNIPKSNCYVATSNTTAVNLQRGNFENANLVYFIQGFETWNMCMQDLIETYHYDMKKIVISKDLQVKLHKLAEPSVLIPNGFNFDEFKCYKAIESRDKYCINMLYHENAEKGCEFGFEAIRIVKERYPQLKVIIWGTSSRPSWLPTDYVYYSRPNNEVHNKINNTSAIFVAPSLNEGWGLTVGEAMMCGEAVVCTDNKGYVELATNEFNALISPIKDYQMMANNICRLIDDDNLRWKLANNGLSFVRKYTWENSYIKFKEVCLQKV